ncbi:MAG: winged helix-turn-helix transcriptional regulator, partial [Verrucomicrobia bacterium]|nr:winged helix-turn-helix transcriptional regulator [Verrucomicrobiota bacterium]
TEFRTAMLLECLGEPVRYQILRHLQAGPKTVGEMARLTKRHQTTVCQHLSVLRSLHLVRYRNERQFTFYELKLKRLPDLLDLAKTCAQELARMPDQD